MIFFDLDGTLLDHDAAVRSGVVEFLKAFRSEFSEDLESFLIRWEIVSERHFQAVNPGQKTSFWAQRRSRMREIFGQDFSDEEADARFKVYLRAYELGWQLYPDVKPCLDALADKRMGLITNGDGVQQREKLRRMGLEDRFSPLIISREVDCAKPDKAIFELAAAQGNLKVENCIYVGDRLDADALGSHRAGMRAIWLNRLGKVEDLPVEVTVIRSLLNLLPLIK